MERKNKNRITHATLSFVLFCSFNVFFISNSLANSGFSIEPIVTQNYGSTWYRLQISEPIISQEDNPLSNTDFTDTVGQSELEYPLDTLIGGIKIKKTFKQQSKHPFSIELFFWENIDNPNEKMKDSDWFGVKNNTVTNLYKFSYTESSSRLNWTGIELSLESSQYHFFQASANYGIKVSADYAYHRLYGADGWRKLPDTSKQTLYLPQNVQVLTYKLWHFEPSAYLKINLIKRQNFLWHTSFSFSPLVVAKDLDDHVLRNKTTKTTALGAGIGLANYAVLNIDQNLSLIGTLDIRFFRTSGNMTQTYYGDDPGSTETDETGLVLNGIDNVISSFTQQASVSLHFKF